LRIDLSLVSHVIHLQQIQVIHVVLKLLPYKTTGFDFNIQIFYREDLTKIECGFRGDLELSFKKNMDALNVTIKIKISI